MGNVTSCKGTAWWELRWVEDGIDLPKDKLLGCSSSFIILNVHHHERSIKRFSASSQHLTPLQQVGLVNFQNVLQYSSSCDDFQTSGGVWKQLWCLQLWRSAEAAVMISKSLEKCCRSCDDFPIPGGVLKKLWWFTKPWRSAEAAVDISKPLEVCCSICGYFQAPGGVLQQLWIFPSPWRSAEAAVDISKPLVECRSSCGYFQAPGGVLKQLWIFPSPWRSAEAAV